VNVTTNNAPRDIIHGFELTERERSEFDYLEGDDLDMATFFRYKGNVYHLGDAMRVEEGNSLCKGWQGYYGETYFSAVVFKYRGDDQVVVGHAFC
jgi:hypothetical protein